MSNFKSSSEAWECILSCKNINELYNTCNNIPSNLFGCFTVTKVAPDRKHADVIRLYYDEDKGEVIEKRYWHS